MMKLRSILVGLLVSPMWFSIAQAQITTFSPTTSSSTSTGTPGRSDQTGQQGANGTTLQGLTSGRQVEIREGFLNPLNKTGFLMPSNTQTTARSRTTGTTARTTTAGGRTSGLGSLRGLGGLTGMRGLGSQFGNANQSGMGGTNQPLRIPMRMAAVTSAPIAIQPAVVTRFQQRVTKLPGFGSLKGVQVSVEDRTAVLRGTVATDHQRHMLTRLALLEPGVSNVRNELTVDASAASQPEVLPPAAPSGTAP